MWPFDTWGDNPMLPLFEGAKRTAANIPAPGEQGNYSADDFAEDYPEFYTVTDGVYTPMLPAAMLERFIESANAAVIPSRWGSDWRLAVGLYTAHLVALRMQTYADGSTRGAAASNSANVGTVKSASMGDTSISYDNAATNAGTEKWGAWNLTKYGSQLATMARMLGIAGTYVI